MRPLAALVLSALLLAGCAAGATDADEGAGGGATDGGGFAPGAGSDEGTTDDDARQVVTKGTVTLTAEDPRRAAADAAVLVEHVGGHVQERAEQAGGDGEAGSARLTVRVPAAELTRVLDQLEQLGDVQAVDLVSTDVTTTVRDLDARVRALQISVARLEDLLGRAQSTADLVAAEQTLTERQGELESLQSRRAQLSDQVELSTVQLLFWATDDVPPPPATGLVGGLTNGWDALLTTLGTLLLVLGFLLPWVAAAGLVAGVVLLVVRRRHHRTPSPAAARVPAGAGVGGPDDAAGPQRD